MASAGLFACVAGLLAIAIVDPEDSTEIIVLAIGFIMGLLVFGGMVIGQGGFA